tara:strand:+ start:235 stop:525 length:291 start_codon:yes stop_codon:yes gene_type:complete
MRARELMELGPVEHHNKQNYARIDSTPYEVKSKVHKRDYNFSPTDSGVEGQLHQQVDKKLEPIVHKLKALKRHVKDKSLFQQILDKEIYIQKAINA